MKIAVIGVGNVGLPFAAVLAQYHTVIGIDLNPRWIADLINGIEITEPEVNVLLKSGDIDFTTDISKIHDCKFIFIIVGTQGAQYAPDNIISSIETIKSELRDPEQVLVIMSTMKPSAMKRFILPLLNRTQILPRIKGVVYNPVMLALGIAVSYFKNPQCVFIGEQNSAGQDLEKLYRTFLPLETKYFHSSFEDIEVVKFAENFALINKISMLNTLTEFCEHYGADIDFVASCLKEDERLGGKKMWKGGLGFGGTCFPVDARALQDSQHDAMIDPIFTQAIMTVNQRQINRAVSMIRKLGKEKISVLGITYKENTHLIIESQALDIAKKLSEDRRVLIYDPRGIENARKVLGEKVLYTENLETALAFGEIIFLAVQWPEIVGLDVSNLESEKIIVDPWRLLKGKEMKCKYIAFGVGE